jgi:GntR family transcriptional regulator of arabinose operon
VTKYESVKRYLRERIAAGEMRPGDRIPSEEELVQLLQVSRNPVRRALGDLVQEGWIFTLRGSGSYVKQAQNTDHITLSCLLSTEDRRFESELIRGMRIAVDNHPNMNLDLVLKKPGRDTKQMIEVLNSLDASKVGGVLFLPVLDAQRSVNRMLGATLRSLQRPDFAVVALDRFVPECESSYVMTDHARGAMLITDYLLSQGHGNIAILYEHPENTSIDLRFDGVRKSLAAGNREIPRNRMIHLPYEEVSERGEKLVRGLLAEGVSCLFCFENAIALEISRLARRLGMSVPHDFSLCSFDDHSFVGDDQGFLTCVKQQLENIGFFGVDIVLKNLESPMRSPVQMLLEPELVIRRSVAPL